MTRVNVAILSLLIAAIPGPIARSQGQQEHTLSHPPRAFHWQRYEKNPVFPAVPGTWMESQTANPDLLLIDDTYFIYFRGQQGGHDRIGVATTPMDTFDGVTWSIREEPIIDVGPPGSWDEFHVLDPASVYVNGRVYLYYSAVSSKSSRVVCLATSDDGVHFTKFAGNPVIFGGGPEVVVRNGVFYLFFWKRKPGATGFQLHVATSPNGYIFSETQNELVLPVGPPGSWDSHTVETPRIFLEEGLYTMMYCGSDRYNDYPFSAGVATSRDLMHWIKYEKNPVFHRGEEGAWDEGAIWFTTVEKINGMYYMWYEGYGGGTARTEQYGSYLKGGKSQVGMAVLNAPFFYVHPGENTNNNTNQNPENSVSP